MIPLMNRVAQHLGPLHASLEGAIVDALRQVYDANAERHDPALGDDGQSFGLLVAHNARAFLEQELEGYPEVRCSRPLNSFEIAVNGVVLHPCKTGSSYDDSVHDAVLDGSLTRQRFVSENAAQLTLFRADGTGGWMNGSEPAPRLRHLVIAHCGNPHDGLCWVAIGAPRSSGRSGSPWHWVQEILRAEPRVEAVTAEARQTVPTTRFNEIDEPQPVLTLRVQGDQHQLDADQPA
jgi:hypothetical protein